MELENRLKPRFHCAITFILPVSMAWKNKNAIYLSHAGGNQNWMNTMSEMMLQNRYELQELIGRGAFAQVWRAHDHLLNRPVAIKMLERRLVELEGESLSAMFQQEARAVAALNHPHIVHVYDVGQEGWQLYLVMELLPGGDLYQRLQAHGPYVLDETLALLQPIAAALDTAHAAGLVHRDVKPQNILFAPQQRPVLTDFGLVKVLSGSLYVSNPAFSGGQLLGTPEYMAPEQARGQAVDQRTDVYALAVVAFQLLTGSVPFKGDSVISTLFLAASTSRADLRPRLPADLPADFVDLLLAALSAEPNERPASAGEWMAQLQAVQAKQAADRAQRDVAARQAALLQQAQREKISRLAQQAAAAADQRQWDALRGLACALLAEDESHPQARRWLAEVEKQIAPRQPAPSPPEKIKLPRIIKGKPPLDFDWCLVPAGAFTMGEGSKKHTVTLPDYYLARFPTTNAQYRLFIEAGGYNQKEWWTSYGWAWREKKKITRPAHWNDKKWNAPNLPVVGVSWYEAAAFCAWAASASGEAIRLPTEAEWEKGARGTDQRPYPWGSQQPDNTRCNSNKNVGQTTPLGRNSPQGDSPYGCADMSGNVWEWCRSEYRAYPYRADDGRESLPGTANRALRGGSWGSIDDCVRAASRLSYLPAFRSFNIGFRCAQE